MSYASFAAARSTINFTRPDEFQPERWLLHDDEEGAALPSQASQHDRLEASQPFSVGPRSCLGRNMAFLELRLVLAHLFYNFDVSLPGGPDSGLRWTDQKTYATWVKEEFIIRIAERSKQLTEV